MRKKITCWYRIVNGERQYNHFSYGWTNCTSPTPINKEQEQMWKGVEWGKKYGYLINGIVKESEEEHEG